MSAAEITQVAIAVATATAAIAAWRASRFTERSASTERESQRQQATISYLSETREAVAELRKRVGGEPLPQDYDRDHALALDTRALLNAWEYAATGINTGVLDLEIFNKMIGGAVVQQYSNCARHVRLARHDDIDFYDQLESLIDKLLVMRRLSVYRLGRLNRRRLRSLALPSRAARVLRRRDTGRDLPYHDLERILIHEGLEKYKTLIAGVCRVPMYQVSAARSLSEDELQGLLDGSPTHESLRLRDESSIARWQPDLRIVASRDGELAGLVDVALPEQLPRPSREIVSGLLASESLVPSLSASGFALVIHTSVSDGAERGPLLRIMLRSAVRTAEVSLGRRPAAICAAEDFTYLEVLEAEGATRLTARSRIDDESLMAFVF